MDDYLKGMVEPPPDQDPHRRERRFVISELRQDLKIGDDPGIYKSMELVTESELKRRAIQMFNAQWTCADDVRIDILLHGSAPCYICGKTDCHEPFCSREPVGDKRENTDFSPHGEWERFRSEKRKHNQPSPVPTREEWEAWAKNMPSEYVNLWQWRDAMTRWFLSMPIIPRGEAITCNHALEGK